MSELPDGVGREQFNQPDERKNGASRNDPDRKNLLPV